MSAGALVATLLLPVVLGAGLLRAAGFAPGSDRLAWAGWAWVAGALGTGLVVFAWLWTGLGTGSALAPSLAVAVLAVAAFLAGRRVRPVPAAPAPPAPGWERWVYGAAVALAVALVVERIVAGTLIPVLVGDEGEFWALKSKVIYTCGGFNGKFRAAMSDPNRIVYHADYPLLNPMLQVWAFAQAGGITQVANRLPIQMFALAQVLVVAAALRRAVRPAVAAALLVILVAPARSEEWTHQAMGDLMVGTGAVLVFDAWLRSSRAAGGRWVGLGALGLALMLWSKNEALLYTLCIGAAVVAARCLEPRSLVALARPRRAWVWALLPAGVLGLHWWFNARHGFVSAFSEPEQGTLLTLFRNRLATHGPTVLAYFGRRIFFDPAHSNLAGACFVVLAATCPVALWRSPARVPTLALLFAWAGLMAVFVAHPTPPPSDIGQQLRNGAPRVTFQVFAPTVLWIAVAARVLFSAQPSRTFSMSAPRPASLSWRAS